MAHRVHIVLVDVTGKIHVLDFCGRARFCLYQQFGSIDPTPVKRVSRVQRIHSILQTVHLRFNRRVPLKKIVKLAFPHFYHLPDLLFQEGRFHVRPFVQFVHGQTADWIGCVCRKALGTVAVKASVKLIGGKCVLATLIQKSTVPRVSLRHCDHVECKHLVGVPHTTSNDRPPQTVWLSSGTARAE